MFCQILIVWSRRVSRPTDWHFLFLISLTSTASGDFEGPGQGQPEGAQPWTIDRIAMEFTISLDMFAKQIAYPENKPRSLVGLAKPEPTL